MARLIVKSNGFNNQVVELRLGVNRLGRSLENDFQIEHSTISARHCEIALGEGELKVRDCGSTNGTFLAGQQIKEGILRAGQTLCLGDVELFVETTEVTVAIPKYELPCAAPPVVLEDGSLLCPRHPQQRVTHRCPHCKEVLCVRCVHHLRRRGGRVLQLCPMCSHKCELIGVEKKKRNRLMGFLQKTVKMPFAKRQADSE